MATIARMDSKKKALQSAILGIAIVAILMVGFYYFKDRLRKPESDAEFEQTAAQEVVPGEKSEFVGMYSPSDGPLEAEGKRVALFTVNRAEDGGYLGSVKVDPIGGDQSVFFPCVDVKIEASDFFLKCVHETHGSISLDGSWTKSAEGLMVDGKVLWSVGGRSILETNRKFQFLPE